MITISELTELQSMAGHARFMHTNLHMHTPATPWDWNPYTGQSFQADQLTPEIYFEHLNKTTLDLVAITDHNCVSWCADLIALAKQARKNGTSKLHILPGVEITSYEGPHILALFDENKDVSSIQRMLIRLGMTGEGHQTDRVSRLSNNSTNTIQDIFKEVVGEGGLVIGPHVHSRDGLWGPKDFRGREQVLNDNNLRILATSSGSIKRVIEQDGRVRFLHKTMNSENVTNAFAFINISDCHRVDDFEKDTTWIKMCTPSLEGVRQIIFEPELRICHRIKSEPSEHQHSDYLEFTRPKETKHPHLIGVAVTGGLLDGLRLALSPHQNSIIGKNYSGKSSVLDCIRFAMNSVSPDEDSNAKFVGRLRGILSEGGQVRVYLDDGNGQIYAVSRVLSCTKVGTKKDEKWRLEGAPELFRLIGSSFHSESTKDLASIMSLEAYPQGDVVKIKDNVSQQMRIVDSLAKIEEELRSVQTNEYSGQTTIRGKLVENSQGMARLTQRIAEIGEEISGIPDLESEISRLKSLADSPLLDELNGWSSARSESVRLRQALDTLAGELSKFASQSDGDRVATSPETEDSTLPSEAMPIDTAQFEDDAAALPFSSADVARAAEQVQVLARMSAEQYIKAAIASLKAGHDTIDKLILNTNLIYDVLKKRIQKNLGTENSEIAQIVLLERIETKQNQLRTMQDKEKTLAELQSALTVKQEERSEFLKQYRETWEQIRRKRREVVATVNADSSDNIQAELQESCDTTEYLKALDAVVGDLTSSSSRIGNKQAQLISIVEALSPQDLVDFIRQGSVSVLVEAVPGLTENTARILMTMSEEDMRELEICNLQDRFVVKYRREGEPTFTPIDTGLSGGEQALALISVAMVRKPLPLVIDQPEDELGQALITKDLVESIRKVKPHRQLIFVTHVPNIPVLADSEQIIYMRQERTDGNARLLVDVNGSLDRPDIVHRLLELDGGQLAMQKRYDRYAPILDRRR